MRQQPNLPWGDPKVLSALESLTSVFGMRTGGSSPLSSPQWLYNPLFAGYILYDQFPLSKRIDHIFRRLSDLPLFGRGLPPCLKADNCIGSNSEKFVRSAVSVLVEIFVPYFRSVFVSFYLFFLRSSPRPISIGQLHALLRFHLRPINLVVFKGSYYLTIWDILS